MTDNVFTHGCTVSYPEFHIGDYEVETVKTEFLNDEDARARR